MWKIGENRRFWRIATFLPVAVPVALAVFSVVAMIWLVLGQFNGFYVWPTATLAAVFAVKILYEKYPHTNKHSFEEKLCTTIVLAGVVLWVGFNSIYTSQHIHTNRDPATYAVAGIWLAKHDNLNIPKEYPFGGKSEEIQQSSAGFGSAGPGELYAQGAHLLPALLGLIGKLTSPAALLHANTIFGGTALLAVFAFARLIMRHRWAVVATAALSVSLPLIYFSRDTYTEPLALTFVFAAMTLLALAYQTKERLFWMFAGVLAGAGQLARIDSVLSILGLVFAVFAVLLLASKKDRPQTLANVLVFFGALTLVMFIGFIDVMLLSSGYFDNQLGNIMLQMVVFLVEIVVGVIAIAVAWNTKMIAYLDKKTKRWRARYVAMGIGLVCIVLASRPLWMVGHRGTSIGLTEGLQAAAGVPIDGFRDYSEITINWLSWYIGLPLVALSLIGIIIVTYRAMKTKNIIWLMSLAVIFGAALAYLIRPSITPDQIWASRRFLPVVIPGVAVFGALALDWLEKRKKLPWRLDTKVVVVILGTLAIVAPFITTLPFTTTRTYVPMLGQTEAVCKMAPKNAAILWVGMARLNQVQPTRAVCDVASAGLQADLNDKALIAKLAKNAIERGYVPIIGVYGSQFNLIPKQYAKEMREASAIVYKEYNHHLLKAPRDVIVGDRSLLLGELTSDGTIKAIPQN